MEDVAYEKKNSPKLLHISRNELKRMMETPMEDTKLELARRMFIFSSLTGLAYVDVHGLYPHHVSKTADNRTYIREKRGKTNVEAFIPLHPIAELFEVMIPSVRSNIRAILKANIATADCTNAATLVGCSVLPDYHGLNMAVALAFRIQSLLATVFRNRVLRKCISADRQPVVLQYNYAQIRLNEQN